MEPRTQRCEACGAAFGCGAEIGRCWCDHVDLDGAALARLRASYSRCLCPDCLRAAAGLLPLAQVPGGAAPERPGQAVLPLAQVPGTTAR